MTGLKDQCFGVEVEMTGITRKQAAQALADYFGTIPKAKGGVYDTWKVKDPTGKEWKLVSDASIIGEQWTGTEYLENDIKDFRVELVTPKLTYPELPKLQECMRRLKQIGAKVNDSCGIHVHVDAANHNRQSLKNLISIMYSKEDLLFKALQVNEVRAIRFCKKVREPMLRKARALSAEETPDLTQLERIWYEGDVHKTDHYNWTRYYALNLHSVFYRGTVEWRCFNSTLNPNLATAYVNLCLGHGPPRPSPSAAPSCARPAAIMSCLPSGCGWCAWASMAMSSGRPAICCWRIWMGTGPGASTRTAMKSIETRRKNIVRRRGDHEDTN